MLILIAVLLALVLVTLLAIAGFAARQSESTVKLVEAAGKLSEQLAELIEVAPEPGDLLRTELVGQHVLVNDSAGDGYQGMLVSADDSMLRLESGAGRPLMFHDGTTRQAEAMATFVNVPASRVKFVTGVS